MNETDPSLVAALGATNASTRLRTALAIGTDPEPGLVDTLIARCAIEPDFYVRDMLTWALTRLPSEITVPKLIGELRSDEAQARSQQQCVRMLPPRTGSSATRQPGMGPPSTRPRGSTC